MYSTAEVLGGGPGAMMEHGWELSDSVQDEQGLPTQRVGMERSIMFSGEENFITQVG